MEGGVVVALSPIRKQHRHVHGEEQHHQVVGPEGGRLDLSVGRRNINRHLVVGSLAREVQRPSVLSEARVEGCAEDGDGGDGDGDGRLDRRGRGEKRVALLIRHGGHGSVGEPHGVDRHEGRGEDGTVRRDLGDGDDRVDEQEDEGERDCERVELATLVEVVEEEPDTGEGCEEASERDEEEETLEPDAVLVVGAEKAALRGRLVPLDELRVDAVAEVDEEDHLVHEEARRDETGNPRKVGEDVVRHEERREEDSCKGEHLADPEPAVNVDRAGSLARGEDEERTEEAGEREGDAERRPLSSAVVAAAEVIRVGGFRRPVAICILTVREAQTDAQGGLVVT
mmetsp:Transcript_50902/g.108748  ORF Transcript_50902/g.108748 Transcript_50902/m.108748 type:complete len:341 (+) Transcript_50902:817-1839(+)